MRTTDSIAERWLAMGGNLATIVVAALIVAVGVARFHDVEGQASTFLPAYSPGDRIADTSQLSLEQAEITVLIGTASTCPFCTESMPFYQRLASETARRGIRLVAYTQEDAAVNRHYLSLHGIQPDDVVSAYANGIRLPATPHLVVVRRDGSVIDSWIGRLDRRAEAEVMDAIQGNGSTFTRTMRWLRALVTR
jgi:thiol-disulfide isomerase/thioredoxin